jgi:hypothetical protein
MWENFIEEEARETEQVDGLSAAFLSFLSLKIRMAWLMF